MRYKNTAAKNELISVILLIALLAIFEPVLIWLLSTFGHLPRIYLLSLIMPIVFIPGIIISLVRYIHFANAEFTDVQTVVLTSYHYLFKSYALEGTAKQNGLSINIRTTHSFNIYNYHRYMDTDVLVGYDPKWDKWVVLYNY